MNDSRSYITLDFRNTHMTVVVNVKRGDTARTLYISLADGGTPYQIADGCTATFTAKKPDKTVINNSCTIEGNMIVYPFTDQTCSKDGRMTAEIRLYGSNGKMLTSASFVLEIHKTVLGPNDIPASESQMNALDALILETTALKAETKALKEEVERKLENGDFVGDPGKSAYEYARDGGYTGSEDDFGRKLASEAGRDLTPALRLVVGILQEALYSSDQSGNIQKLAQLLEGGYVPEEPDEPDVPDIPDEPDPPVVKKLATPVIRLVTEGDEPDVPDEPDEPVIPDGNTPAILGMAVLGRTILGVYGNDLPKLAKPVIRLEVVEELPKLAAPVIRLETVAEPDEPEEPDEPDIPVIPKLQAPTIYLDVCKHENNTSEIVTDATCTADGEKKFVCSDCGYEWTGIIPSKGGHAYEIIVTAPTCTEQGYTTHICSVCGDSYVDSYVEATGHSWNGGVVTKEPTEEETGIRTYTCNVCGETKTEVISIQEHVHSYVSWKQDPTCTEKGYTAYICSCGNSYQGEYVDALGHYWGEPYYSDEFASGYGRKCVRCGVLEAMLPKLETPVIHLEEHDLAAPVIRLEEIFIIGDTVWGTDDVDVIRSLYPAPYNGDWVKVLDENGNPKTNANGEILWTIEEVKTGRLVARVELEGDIPSVTTFPVKITSPNGNVNTVRPTQQYPEITMIKFPMGEYHVEEQTDNLQCEGYELETKYTVHITGEEPFESQYVTLTKEKPEATVIVTNIYTKIN